MLKELTDMIKTRQANKQSDNQDMERDLTEQELQELLNPGAVIKFKRRKKEDKDDKNSK